MKPHYLVMLAIVAAATTFLMQPAVSELTDAPTQAVEPVLGRPIGQPQTRKESIPAEAPAAVHGRQKVEDVTAPPRGANKWHRSRLSLETDNRILGGNIVAYRIQWFNGNWSQWFVPGVNDVDHKVNSDGSKRRMWSYFEDHTHRYLIIPDQKLAADSPASARPRMAMTWKRVRHDPELEIDLVGLAGGNAYTGDTSVEESLPILAIRVDDAPRPNYAVDGRAHAMPKEYYRGWSGGEIRLTPPIQGTLLTSQEVADKFCRKHCGEGFRMASFHDGQYVLEMDERHLFGDAWTEAKDHRRTGGWNFWATGNIPDDTRFWVRIGDQNANCWEQ